MQGCVWSGGELCSCLQVLNTLMRDQLMMLFFFFKLCVLQSVCVCVCSLIHLSGAALVPCCCGPYLILISVSIHSANASSNKQMAPCVP